MSLETFDATIRATIEGWRVRNKPSTVNSNVITTIPIQTTICEVSQDYVEDDNYLWYYVRFQNGDEGYFAQYKEFVNEGNQPPHSNNPNIITYALSNGSGNNDDDDDDNDDIVVTNELLDEIKRISREEAQWYLQQNLPDEVTKQAPVIINRLTEHIPSDNTDIPREWGLLVLGVSEFLLELLRKHIVESGSEEN